MAVSTVHVNLILQYITRRLFRRLYLYNKNRHVASIFIIVIYFLQNYYEKQRVLHLIE